MSGIRQSGGSSPVSKEDVRPSFYSGAGGAGRQSHASNPTRPSASSPASKTSKNSVAMLQGRAYDSERIRQGLETSEEALKADYPLLNLDKNRVPRGRVMLWSLPFFGWYGCKYMKNSYMRLFYVDDYPKASLGYIALFSVLAVIIDAFTDPLMANVTDNARPKRWGRRAPFVVIGGLMTWFTFTFSYLPLVPSGVAASLWYGVFHIMFKLSDTTLLIAQEAWGVEMSPSSQERSKIWAWRELMLIVGVIFGIVVPGQVTGLGGADCFTPAEDFKNPAADCLGLPVAGFIFGALCFSAVLLWVCTAKERSTDRLPPVAEDKWSDENIVPMLISSWCNRPFKYIIASEVAEAFGQNMPFAILPFYLRIVVGAKCMDPVKMLSLVGTVNLLCRLVSLPLWVKAAEKLGPVNALMIHNFLLAASHVPFIIVGRDTGSCNQFMILLVLAAFWGATFGGNYLIRAVTSSIADYDTFITGRRREAQYMMVSGFLPKFWEAFAESLPILMLAYYGYVRPTEQDPDPEQNWKVSAIGRMSVSVVPAGFILLGAITMLWYPKAARAKNAHKELVAAIMNKHALGKEAKDPWYPSRTLAPPGEPGQYQGVLSFFFPFELKKAAGVLGEGGKLNEEPNYGALIFVQKATIGLGLFLAIPAVYFIVVGAPALGDDLGASKSPPGLIGLGFSLLLVWFGTIRYKAAKEVERLGVPLEDIVEHFNYMCRFTCEEPMKLPGKMQGDTIGASLPEKEENEAEGDAKFNAEGVQM